ncbi:DUF6891 domain-containing protein [Spirillospora sp. CA-294931]|uniref:DUF6891 domain-containing protein n=1 Tax=Spirillospora sp. CA-294931 TaxID=3240042 RepID=UPI003D8C7BCC
MIDEVQRTNLREHLRLLLALGEDDFDGVVRGGVEYLRGTADEAEVAELAREFAVEEFAGYLAEQETWPEVLESDRVLRAFRDLDLAGIVARADYACCQNCGIAEIGGQVPADEHDAYRGYAFCHRQDMAGAVTGDGLYLAFGIFTDADPPAEQAAIGAEVAAALRDRGLEVTWNGDTGARIEVPLTWRRPRFGPFAAWPDGPEASSSGPLLGSYCDYRRGRHIDESVPMSLAEAKAVLLELTPRENNFAVFEGESGEVVQVFWEKGRRLWLESPDPESRSSRGRHVTPDEADDVVTVLAREGRADLERLGDLRDVPWEG